jgi:hypothetical protein
MSLFQSYMQRRRERRWARQWEYIWSQAGGRDTYEQEVAELAERAAAVPTQHARVKQALNIGEAFNTAYDTSHNPLQAIAEVTVLHPARASPKHSHRDISGGSDYEDHRVVGLVVTETSEKFYMISPRVFGSRFYDASAERDGRNIGPRVGVMYYDRTLAQTTNGGPHSPGIQTVNPQFAVLIQDGFEAYKTEASTFAGVDTGQRQWRQKQPTRVCMLGEVDPTGDVLSVRRLIVDGQQLELTRESVALTVVYAELLVAQIFAGKGYDPALAMQTALSVRARITAPQSVPK